MIASIFANPWLCSLLVIVGFVCLVYGADWLVDGASAIARHYGVSSLVIGLTVVAFGTSMPEFIVSTIAAVEHNTNIAITNILGSNSLNVFIILGLSAIIYPISSQRQCRRFDIPWSLLAGLIVLGLATYTRPAYFRWGNFGAFSFQYGFISGVGGWMMLACFAVFMWHSIRYAKAGAAEQESDQNMPSMSMFRAVVLVAVGLVCLVLGGELVVRSATSIATMLGVSDAIIGLTVVAFGTSLPELATSCVAAYKKNVDLALGNVVGSNIFNVFLILGVSAVIHPLPLYPGLWLDAAMVALSSLMVMLFIYLSPRHEISRWHGAVLVLTYATYLTYRLMTV